MAKHEPQPCMPCRGTGKVISNLGDTTQEVPCPWCEGGGTRLPSVDAQSTWLEGDGSGGGGGKAAAHAAG
jgi:DnaJ-class molecular chaperone